MMSTNSDNIDCKFQVGDLIKYKYSNAFYIIIDFDPLYGRSLDLSNPQSDYRPIYIYKSLYSGKVRISSVLLMEDDYEKYV